MRFAGMRLATILIVLLFSVGAACSPPEPEKSPLSISLEEEIMASTTTTWLSGGVRHTHTTNQQTGESAADFAERHIEVVRLLQASGAFPPDPEQD